MQRARLILAVSATVVAAITASHAYSVLMRTCDPFSIEWYERIGVVSALTTLYAGAAYVLLKIALTNRLPDRSWSRSLLIFILALCFGAITLFSAPSVFTALQFAADLGFDAAFDSSFCVATAELASYLRNVCKTPGQVCYRRR